MRKQAEFHSSLDFSQAPAPLGWRARLWRQMQLQLLLTFYPHPDSSFYPSRSRVLMAAILALLGVTFLGYYWWDIKRNIPHYGGILAAILVLSLLVMAQVLWQPIPRLKNTLIFPVFLWFCIPVFFFLDYLFMAGRWPSLEYLCLMLLLYANLLHWRAAGLGMLVGLAFSLGVFQLLGGQLFYPSALDIFGVTLAAVGGLVSSYTFGRADSLRYEQNARTTHIISKRLEAAFGVQLALSEALRHEVERSTDGYSKNRLAEVAQNLDLRANLIRAQLQEIEKEAGQMQILGIQILQVERLCPAVMQELEGAYGWPEQSLRQDLQCEEEPGLALQGVWMETVQLLASVIALMLRHTPDRPEQQARRVRLRWDQTAGSVRLSVVSAADAGALAVLDAQQNRRAAAEHWVLAERLLPAYSIYVMKKMRAQLQIHTTASGQVHSLRVSWPQPDMLQNRFTGYRPLSLLQMHENHRL